MTTSLKFLDSKLIKTSIWLSTLRSWFEIKFLEFMPTKRFNERQKQRCMAVWIGGIFLKDEGGYEIVLRSLEK